MIQLGKYEIIEELGRGGFGVVYKARDLSLEREVALKVLHPQLTVDARFINNFKREARNLAKVEHPNVVAIYEISEEQGRLFIAMRYLPGGSLADRIAEGPIALQEALQIIRQVTEGLGAGHKRGIIHRDVKPGNILFDEEGHALIADFGVARAVHLSTVGTTSEAGSAVGTPFYRPPELWRGTPAPSPATDVYSLACVLNEMLTGEVLFKGETPDQVLTRHVLDDAAALIDAQGKQIDQRTRACLAKALSKDPSDRYADMAALQQALMGGVKKAPEAKPEPVRKRKPLPVAVGSPGKLGEGHEQKEVQQQKHLPKWVWWVGGVGMLGLVIVWGILQSLGIEAPEPPTPTKIAEYAHTLEAPLVVGSTLINERDDAEMVAVPAGEFLMGSESADAYKDENPEHTVYLDAYWIYKYEVTNAQYRQCIEDDVCSGSLSDYPQDNYPAVDINWYEAQAYCEWAGGRLPTEAEWEKAARGTDGRTYPWGNVEVSGENANYCDQNCSFEWADTNQNDGYEFTALVGSYPAGASPYGALDMAGNVWEWVGDWYDETYYKRSPDEDPTGPPDGTYRVLRGGSWGGFVRGACVSRTAAGTVQAA